MEETTSTKSNDSSGSIIHIPVEEIHFDDSTDLNTIETHIPCFISNTILLIDKRIIMAIPYFRKLYNINPNKHIHKLTHESLNLDALITIIGKFNGNDVKFKYSHVPTLKFLGIKFEVTDFDFEDQYSRYLKMLQFTVNHFYHHRGKTNSEKTEIEIRRDNIKYKIEDIEKTIKGITDSIKSIDDELTLVNMKVTIENLEELIKKKKEELEQVLKEYEEKRKIHDEYNNKYLLFKNIEKGLTSNYNQYQTHQKWIIDIINENKLPKIVTNKKSKN